MRPIKFKAIRADNGEWVFGDYYKSSFNYYIRQHSSDGGFEDFKIDNETVSQFTEYEMDKEVYFDDLVSNNFGTDKEVIRQVVLHEGCIMLKKVKGKSRLVEYISLHEFYQANFKVVGNIHDKK